MRSLRISRFGGPEVLEVVTEPTVAPGPGEIRISVKRAGLNFADITARVGLYPDAPKPPMVVGYEVSGVVDALGDGVTGFSMGQRVLAFTHFRGQADFVVVPQALVFTLPDSVGFDEAAALPVNYLTAWHAAFHVTQVRENDCILIQAAAGGVGLALIQLCRHVEGVTLLGTASPAKHERLLKEGLHHAIDYRHEDYAERVRHITQGRGVNKVFDSLGGPDWEKAYGLLANAGHLLCFGWSNMVNGETRSFLRVGQQFLSMPRYSPVKLMQENKSVSGINMGHLWDEKALLRSHMQKLMKLLVEGGIRPHIDRVFPLSKAADAHRYVQGRQNFGKVLFDCTA